MLFYKKCKIPKKFLKNRFYHNLKIIIRPPNNKKKISKLKNNMIKIAIMMAGIWMVKINFKILKIMKSKNKILLKNHKINNNKTPNSLKVVNLIKKSKTINISYKFRKWKR